MATTTAPTLPALDVSKSDDPRVVEEAATEDYSLHVVPRTWRMDKVKLTMAWYAVMTAFFYMYFAAFIARMTESRAANPRVSSAMPGA